MSKYEDWKAATISAGSSKSSAVDLGWSNDYLDIQVPYMDNACKLSLEVSETLGGTYYDLGKDVTTDESNFDRADVWQLGGYRYVKVVTSVGQPTDKAIRVRGWRY